MSTKTINGPMNAVRLEGKVGKIQKVIYLFMDIHFELSRQTECHDIMSLDIKDYFVDTFQTIEPNRIIDFVFEIGPRHLVNQFHGKDIYIREVAKLFKSNFMRSNRFKSIRFHYSDIRTYFYKHNWYDITYSIRSYGNQMWSNRHLCDSCLKKVMSNIDSFNHHMQFIYDAFFTDKYANMAKLKVIIPPNEKELNEMTSEVFDKIIIYLIDKMRNKYTNKTVKDVINKLIDVDLRQLFYNYFDAASELSKSIMDTQKKIVPDDSYNNEGTYGTDYKVTLELLTVIQKLIFDYVDMLHDVYVFIMDIYFLRRFLDKSYITNVVAYTGINHSLNYIFTLVKKCNFRVTHWAYANGADVNKLIKAANNVRELDTIFFPRERVQCSDLSSFPSNFT